MGILSDRQIKRDIKITPFAEGIKREGVVSYGLSSYGYDARLGYQFRILKPYPTAIIDPKNFNNDMFDIVTIPEGQPLEIPPHSFVLGETIEHFKIPRDVLCVVTGKSTYARCGVYINVTPGEPEWEGIWTVEISNTTPRTARIYPGEGIMQCLFFRTDESREVLIDDYLKCHGEFDRQQLQKLLSNASCEVSYANKKLV
jgi:dCTP deaminase